jgi:glycosyltransferase involved in cell wall biosynthesis
MPRSRDGFAVADPVLVVVPTHDRPAMLAEAVESVRAQRDRDWALVVADDGEAAPVDRAAAWASDPRVHVVRAGTRTAGGARNAALARGDALGTRFALVAFLDDDDLWGEGHLAAARARLEARPDATFVHGAATTRGQGGERPYHERGEGPLEGDLFRTLLRRDAVATSTVVARLDAVRAEGGFRADLRNGQDWDLWLRLARRGPAAFVPEPHVVYRAHGGNASRHLVRKAEAQARVLEHWWARRHLLLAPERRTLRRELARRHRRHVKRLLAAGETPARDVRRLAWRLVEEVPHPFTALAALESSLPHRR